MEEGRDAGRQGREAGRQGREAGRYISISREIAQLDQKEKDIIIESIYHNSFIFRPTQPRTHHMKNLNLYKNYIYSTIVRKYTNLK